MPESLGCKNSNSKWDNIGKAGRICSYLKNCSSPRLRNLNLGCNRSYATEVINDGWISVGGGGWATIILPHEKRSRHLVIHLLLLRSNETAWTMDLVYPCSLTIPSVPPLPPIADTHFFPEIFPTVHQLGCNGKKQQGWRGQELVPTSSSHRRNRKKPVSFCNFIYV